MDATFSSSLISPPPTPDRMGVSWNENMSGSSVRFPADKSSFLPETSATEPRPDPSLGMHQRVKVLHEDLNKFDRGLNFSSVIPIAGVICTFVKTLAYSVILIAAGVFKIVTAIGIAIAKKKGDLEGQRKWEFLSNLAELHCNLAACSIVGGIAQTLIGAATLGVGNLLFVIPNAQEGKDWFAARAQYPTTWA